MLSLLPHPEEVLVSSQNKHVWLYSGSRLAGLSVLAFSLLALTPLPALAQSSSETTPEDAAETEEVEIDSDTATEPSEPEVVVETPRFACQMYTGQPTVMYLPESQPNQAYPWAVPTQLGSGWTPERRCEEISRRLEFYRPDGLLDLRTGKENNYDVVCVTTEADPSCRIVFTIPPGQDPLATRDRVFDNLTLADSGTSTQPVNTFANPNASIGSDLLDDLANLGLPRVPDFSRPRNWRPSRINLQPFLAPEDGGTGQYLNSRYGTRSSSPLSPASPRLNPDNFR